MPASNLLAFWAVAALLIAVPGADWAFAIAAGLRRQALAAATGITLGYLAMTAVVAAGLGLLITSTPAALTALTVAGACYLAWLGGKTLRNPSGPTTSGDTATSPRHTVSQGFAVSALNPKGLLVFVALLPQFTTPAASWPIPLQLAALGLAFTATCAVVYLCVAATAHAVLRARPAAARVVSRVSGASMILIGAALVLERVMT
ncbi:LysE family translocator [Crossiella sp. CA-258035]|uniref:LysE family translocator n=1 Tax=Crossiella sp. CA-258035 TaxID=2981138 RepID=UPI0024BC7A04|nr:LysE family translocator [Crossiella sp. CA-258035]WHT15678.1 LysE family translocator [Crossiella sp. CA-258035]